MGMAGMRKLFFDFFSANIDLSENYGTIGSQLEVPLRFRIERIELRVT